jgi:hypothetical protein
MRRRHILGLPIFIDVLKEFLTWQFLAGPDNFCDPPVLDGN